MGIEFQLREIKKIFQRFAVQHCVYGKNTVQDTLKSVKKVDLVLHIPFHS